MDTLHRHAIIMLAASLISALTGCLPQRVLIDLNPNPTKLEKSVLEDGSIFANQVAIISLQGVISETPGGAGIAGLGSAGLSPVDQVLLRLHAAEKDNAIKAIILRINSPGGTVSASETLYDEIRRFAERTDKPIIASMGGLATSGGYYVALAADEIFAQQSTITGSIGVLIQTFNLSGGMKMIGVRGRAITSANNKDIANPFEPESNEHYEILQTIVDEFYQAFTSKVQNRRQATITSNASKFFDGRVITGPTAQRAGLIDTIGNVRQAFQRAQQLAGIENASLVAWHTPGRKPASIFGSAGAHTQHNATPPPALLQQLPDARAYYIWRPMLTP